MKKILVLFLLFPLASFAQKEKKVNNEEKDFALNVIKAIIEDDCESYYDAISDSVVLYLRVEDTLVAKSDIESKIKMLCRMSVRNDTLTFPYYTEHFDLQFIDATTLTNEEFYGSGEEVSTLGNLKYYEIKEGDILFNGAHHKTRNRLDFILDDAFKFIMRKVNGGYKVIVMMN